MQISGIPLLEDKHLGPTVFPQAMDGRVSISLAILSNPCALCRKKKKKYVQRNLLSVYCVSVTLLGNFYIVSTKTEAQQNTDSLQSHSSPGRKIKEEGRKQCLRPARHTSPAPQNQSLIQSPDIRYRDYSHLSLQISKGHELNPNHTLIYFICTWTMDAEHYCQGERC